MATVEEIIARLKSLSPQGLEQVYNFIEKVQRAETQAQAAAWSFDFLKNSTSATQSASRDRAGMEIKVADATCGGVTRAALWEHPPASGAAIVSFHVPVPAGLSRIKLKFAVGIRDGAELPKDRVIAFRVIVNDWKLWSTVKNSHVWEERELEMPQVSSDVARIDFVTDGLGDSRWNWAVWAEPRLEGE